MKRPAFWSWLLAGILLLSLVCVACGDGDDDTDGDTPDGDTPTDGDDPDGDDPDGDAPVDGDEPDGDTERCDPGTEGLCFRVLSGERAGNYFYLRHDVLPSGCTLDQKGFGVQYFEGWATFSLLVENYDNPREYNQNQDSIQVQWSVEIGEGEGVEYLNYRNMLPCKILVQNANEGAFECKLYDNNDALVAFDVKGVWRCP